MQHDNELFLSYDVKLPEFQRCDGDFEDVFLRYI